MTVSRNTLRLIGRLCIITYTLFQTIIRRWVCNSTTYLSCHIQLQLCDIILVRNTCNVADCKVLQYVGARVCAVWVRGCARVCAGVF